MALRLRRGTNAERQTITPLQGELIYTTDTKKLYVGDGSTLGGVLIGATVLDDTAPLLGGDLDLNGNNITGTGNINIDGTITATGNIGLGDAESDVISVGGLINSSLKPSLDDTHDLGSASRMWANVWSTQVNVDTTLAVGSQIIKLTDGDVDSSVVLWDAETDTITAREIVGDLRGSVFSDDSTTVLVDAINGVFNGTLDTGDAVLEARELTSLTSFSIGSKTNSMALDLNLDSNLQIHQVLDLVNPNGYLTTIIGRGTLAAPEALQAGDELGGLLLKGYSDNGSTSAIGGIISFIVDPTASIVEGGDYIKSLIAISASSDTGQAEEDAVLIDSSGTVASNVFSASKYFQLPVYEDDAARLAAIPTPAEGMMIFMQSGGTPAATNQMQVFDGTNWVNAS